MTEKLKPCPFCGGQPIMATTYSNGIFTCVIECDCCYIRTPAIGARDLDMAKDEAITAWNRRAE